MEGSSAEFSKFLSNAEEKVNGKTLLKQTVFVYEWSIENFGDFLERKYEIPSPIFCTNLKDATEWKLVLFQRSKYPGGSYIFLSLVKVSDDINSIGVKYAVSIVSSKITELMLAKEKIFRHRLDFDECELMTHSEVNKNRLLKDNALTIRCEMDILFVETLHSETKEQFSHLQMGQPVSNKDFSNQDLPNMNSSFDQSKIINKFEDSYNILDKESEEFENSSEVQSPLKNEDSINSLLDDFESLYKNKSFSDVILICNGIPIAAHRAVLSTRSVYFKQLCGEKSNSGKIIISDVKSSVMEEVLYYIYTGKVRHFEVPFALDIYSASKKFKLSKLEGLFFDFLKSNITVTNVTEMLQVCEDFNLLDLKYACLKFVNSNNSEVVRSEKWNWLIKNNPHIAGEVLLTIASFQKTNIL